MDDALFDDVADRPARELAAGAHWIPNFLPLDEQAWIMDRFQEWVNGPVPIRGAKVRGQEMSVRTLCLGWHWRPYRYSREAVDVNGNRVLGFPDWMVGLGRRALVEASGDPRAGERYTPDTALINLYDDEARMGMHQDKDELSLDPVISLSIGDSCTFRFGNTEARTKPYEDIVLRSGDLFVFGGPSRLAFHGVTRVHPGTAPDGCGLKDGRINITMRVTGLTD